MLRLIKSSPQRMLPSDADIMNIPLATAGEYELSNTEVKQLRSRIYALNKDNVRYRFRTMRSGTLLMVWRIA